MRIAQVAPLIESVPPAGYGGTERVASYLTEELVREGHEVTLFASGDSRTAARLVAGTPRALRLLDDVIDPLAHMVVQLEQVAAEASNFDVIHWHLDYFHFPMSRRLGVPQLTTLHGRLDIPDLQPVYAEFRDMPLVSISDNQRSPLPHANWVGTVYHGLPADEFLPSCQPGDYLAFLGRISREKRADRAIEIARRAGMRCGSLRRSMTWTARTTPKRSNPCWRRRTSNSRARWPALRSEISWPERERCCSRSIGQSLSAWS